MVKTKGVPCRSARCCSQGKCNWGHCPAQARVTIRSMRSIGARREAEIIAHTSLHQSCPYKHMGQSSWLARCLGGKVSHPIACELCLQSWKRLGMCPSLWGHIRVGSRCAGRSARGMSHSNPSHQCSSHTHSKQKASAVAWPSRCSRELADTPKVCCRAVRPFVEFIMVPMTACPFAIAARHAADPPTEARPYALPNPE